MPANDRDGSTCNFFCENFATFASFGVKEPWTPAAWVTAWSTNHYTAMSLQYRKGKKFSLWIGQFSNHLMWVYTLQFHNACTLRIPCSIVVRALDCWSGGWGSNPAWSKKNFGGNFYSFFITNQQKYLALPGIFLKSKFDFSRNSFYQFTRNWVISRQKFIK